MKYGIEEKDWEKLISVFSRFPHIYQAVLFGSRAKGTNKPFSDVDIALVGDDLTIDDLLHLQKYHFFNISMILVLLLVSFGAKRDLAVSDYLHDILRLMVFSIVFAPYFGLKMRVRSR